MTINRLKSGCVLFLGLLACQPAVASDSHQLEYDETNRLIRITHADTSYIEYTYDDVGNRLSLTSVDNGQQAAEVNGVIVTFPAAGQADFNVDVQLNHHAADVTLFWGTDASVPNSLSPVNVPLSVDNQHVPFSLTGQTPGSAIFFKVLVSNAHFDTETNVESFELPEAAQAELSVAYSGMPAEITDGTNDYQVLVTNNSGVAALDVTLVDTINGKTIVGSLKSIIVPINR